MSLTLLVGDVLEQIATLPDNSIRCCVTSPPYWGLRSYLPNGVVLRSDLPPEKMAAVIAELQAAGVHPIDHTQR